MKFVISPTIPQQHAVVAALALLCWWANAISGLRGVSVPGLRIETHGGLIVAYIGGVWLCTSGHQGY
jgi:hypothetical protein